jgi:hypothetical protein
MSINYAQSRAILVNGGAVQESQSCLRTASRMAALMQRSQIASFISELALPFRLFIHKRIFADRGWAARHAVDSISRRQLIDTRARNGGIALNSEIA